MSALFLNPDNHPLSNIGTILPAASWTFYLTNTTTLASVFDDDGDALPNPVQADAFGRFPSVYLDETITYRVILKTVTGVVLLDVDPYSAPAGSSSVYAAIKALQDQVNTTLPGLQPIKPQNASAPVANLVTRAIEDFLHDFYDPVNVNGPSPGYRPCFNLAGLAAATPYNNSGVALNNIRKSAGADLWMTFTEANMDWQLWKFRGDEYALTRLREMAARLYDASGTNGYTAAELASDGAVDGSISLLDDAALKARGLMQLWEATNDPALRVVYRKAYRSIIPAVLRRFHGNNPDANKVQIVNDDGSNAAVDGQPFYYWLHGAAYDNSGANANYTNIHETTLARTACRIYEIEGFDAFYHYAYATYFRVKEEYQPRAGANGYGSGNFYESTDFTLNPVTSPQAYFGHPAVGASSLSMHQSFEMAMLAWQLYNLPRTSAADKATFLADIKAIVTSIQRPQTSYGFVVSNDPAHPERDLPIQGIFLAWGDAWEDFQSSLEFVRTILTIPDVDPAGACAAIFLKTGQAALATRKPGVNPAPLPAPVASFKYTADWAGQMAQPVNYGGVIPGYTGYEPYGLANPGSTYNATASSWHAMTNCMAILAGACAACVEEWGPVVVLPPQPTPTTATATGLALAIDADGELGELELNIPALVNGDGTPASDNDRQINIRWSKNAAVVSGDPVWTWIKTTLGKSNDEMAALMAAAKEFQ